MALALGKGNGLRASHQEKTMTDRKNTSASRIALGAVLLVLAATASSCGMALPTQPALEAGVTAQHGAATSSGEPIVTEDPSSNGGGSGTDQPGGEEIVPTPSAHDPGNSTWGHSHKKPKHS
jgi:hypothetical protein